jgi:hypothetical protein
MELTFLYNNVNIFKKIYLLGLLDNNAKWILTTIWLRTNRKRRKKRTKRKIKNTYKK